MDSEEVESKRRNILDAAMSLFNRKPFEEVGIREIAREADVSCGTIYRYFPSQDDLFVEVLLRYLKVVRKIVDANFDAVQKSREEENEDSLKKIADLALDFLIGNPAAFRIMCYFMVTRKLEIGTLNKFETLHQDFFRMFDKILIKAGAAPDDHTYFPLFLASIFGVVLMFRNMPGVAKEDARAFIRSYTEIIATVYKNGMETGV